jgi:2-methylcitrate dehydratase PrpD
MAAGLRRGGEASLPGLGRHADAEAATLVNATAGSFLEVDEGNRFSHGHPAIHVLPAVLALGEAEDAGADAFLSALVAGYEVGSRLGAASHLHAAMHPHGTWGTMGAAAGCARVLGFGTQDMREAINVGASMSIATSRQTMLQGGLVRNLYAGLAGRNGLLAARLVPCGFTGERDGPASLLGGIVSDRFDPAEAIRGLGQLWHMRQNYFKLHACCRYNHGALDALDQLAVRDALPPAEAIESIEVRTYGLAAQLSNPAPHNTLAAKFSLPFAIASRIIHGSSSLGSFTWQALGRDDVLALARKVALSEDPEMTKRLPGERPARVTILDRAGHRHVAEVHVNRGDDLWPYSEAQLQGKFIDLCTRVWPQAHARAVFDATMAMAADAGSGTPQADRQRLRDWTALLRHAPLPAGRAR